jgi:hypothetical protein
VTKKQKGLIMLKTSKVVVETKVETTVSDVTKDAGRVHIGGGAIHFADVKVTKDSGRVHIGGGAINF